MPFATTPQPRESLWGTIETAEQVLPGIWRVETPSHGGLILSEERQAAMPDPLRYDIPQYEEDVLWSLPVLAFEAEFAKAGAVGTDIMRQLAHDVARNWRPDDYGAFTGKPVEPRDSYVMRRRAAYEALIGKVVVTSASASWADWVPDGKIGVVGRMVASVDYLGWPTYEGPDRRGLVPAESYDSAKSPIAFDTLDVDPLP